MVQIPMTSILFEKDKFQKTCFCFASFQCLGYHFFLNSQSFHSQTSHFSSALFSQCRLSIPNAKILHAHASIKVIHFICLHADAPQPHSLEHIVLGKKEKTYLIPSELLINRARSQFSINQVLR